MAMGDEVNIDSISVACTAHNGSSDNQLEFFSTKGFLRLETNTSFFDLSYSVVTSATGTLFALFHACNLLIKYLSS